VAGEEVERELEATVAARKELGPEHDEQLIQGFLDRIDGEIDRRVEERVARRRPQRPLVVNKETIAIAVPVVAVAGIFGGHIGVVGALIAPRRGLRRAQRVAPMSAPPATMRAAPSRSLFPTSSDSRRRSAESATPTSDSIATSGATTVTRPR
jgi:hypothetical protein